MQKAEKRLSAILKKAEAAGVTYEKLATLHSIRTICQGKPSGRRNCVTITTLFLLFAGFIYTLAVYFTGSECLIPMVFDAAKLFREPVNCNMCRDVKEVDKVTNISSHDFENNYSSKLKPVVIIDGTRGWLATEEFNFEFFKQLYEGYDEFDMECQFFPYKTEFRSLREVLNMSEERSRLEPGTKPWYIGWSNCNEGVGRILREYYNRPYFLPENSESIITNWIFMGGPGFGAHMHVDNVQFASWQAQLRGRKLWRLAPPPECYYTCNQLEVTLNPGEIIAIDTNRWYHQTLVLPGEISITIGAEFD